MIFKSYDSSKSFQINNDDKKLRKKNTRTDTLFRIRNITLYNFPV